MWHFFPDYLSLVKLGRVIWNCILRMKTILSLHFYQRKTVKSKSDVIGSILQTPHDEVSEFLPVEVKIFDRPALVNMLPPSNCKTFLGYSCEVYVPYLESQSRLVAKLDLVWDCYFEDSLKGRSPK